MVFKKLFEPLRIGAVELKNRYGVAPVNCMHSDCTGMVSEEDRTGDSRRRLHAFASDTALRLIRARTKSSTRPAAQAPAMA